MGQNTKIDWADATWNPVTGCLHGCEYCYARGIANRFAMNYAPKLGDLHMEGAKKYDSSEGITMLEIEKPYVYRERKQPFPMGFYPTFHRYRLDIPQHWKKPRNIFVCSMADLFGEWVPDEWIKEVFDACRRAPQHRYLFLTKNPAKIIDLACTGRLPEDENMWYGTTITKSSDMGFHWWLNSPEHNTFLSIEPLLEPFPDVPSIKPVLERINWVIIGAESGNRRGKVIPEWSWVRQIEIACEDMSRWQGKHIPVFMKESLREIMGTGFRQEFPWEV